MVDKSIAVRKKRLAVDMAFKIESRCRQRVHQMLKKTRVGKTQRFSQLLGCTAAQLKEHLESKWTAGMTWANYGVHGWHIDHIRPCASFDLTDSAQQRECFHWSNLQPLWAADNIRKGDHYETDAQVARDSA